MPRFVQIAIPIVVLTVVLLREVIMTPTRRLHILDLPLASNRRGYFADVGAFAASKGEG